MSIVTTACLSLKIGTSAVVVTADKPTPTALYAARELVSHMKEATGVTLPVVTESAEWTGGRVRAINSPAGGSCMGRSILTGS